MFGSWFHPEVGWENAKADLQGCGCWLLLVGVPFAVGVVLGFIVGKGAP